MTKITANITNEIKRCYIDFQMKYKCEKCNTELICDFNDDHYLSYPYVGKKIHAYFYCDKCDSEYEIPLEIKKMEVELEYDGN